MIAIYLGGGIVFCFLLSVAIRQTHRLSFATQISTTKLSPPEETKPTR